jgi:hypothetical protein
MLCLCDNTVHLVFSYYYVGTFGQYHLPDEYIGREQIYQVLLISDGGFRVVLYLFTTSDIEVLTLDLVSGSMRQDVYTKLAKHRVH